MLSKSIYSLIKGWAQLGGHRDMVKSNCRYPGERGPWLGPGCRDRQRSTRFPRSLRHSWTLMQGWGILQEKQTRDHDNPWGQSLGQHFRSSYNYWMPTICQTQTGPVSSVCAFKIAHLFINMSMYEQLSCMSDYVPKCAQEWRQLKANISAPFMRKDALEAVIKKRKSTSWDLFFPWESQGRALYLHQDVLTMSNYIKPYLCKQ